MTFYLCNKDHKSCCCCCCFVSTVNCAFSVGRCSDCMAKLVIWRTIPQFKLCLHFNKMIQEIRTFSSCGFRLFFSLYYYFFLSFCCQFFRVIFGGVQCSSWREINKRQPLNCQIGSLLLFLACATITPRMLTNTLHDDRRHETTQYNWWIGLALNNSLINQLNFFRCRPRCLEFRAGDISTVICNYEFDLTQSSCEPPLVGRIELHDYNCLLSGST